MFVHSSLNRPFWKVSGVLKWQPLGSLISRVEVASGNGAYKAGNGWERPGRCSCKSYCAALAAIWSSLCLYLYLCPSLVDIDPPKMISMVVRPSSWSRRVARAATICYGCWFHHQYWLLPSTTRLCQTTITPMFPLIVADMNDCRS